MEEEFNDDDVFKLSPKGIFCGVLADMDFVEHALDKRADIAWELFESRMRHHGYVQDDED